MKAVIVILILSLFARELWQMITAIENNAKPTKILTPCFYACVIAILAKFVGNLLTTM